MGCGDQEHAWSAAVWRLERGRPFAPRWFPRGCSRPADVARGLSRRPSVSSSVAPASMRAMRRRALASVGAISTSRRGQSDRKPCCGGLILVCGSGAPIHRPPGSSYPLARSPLVAGGGSVGRRWSLIASEGWQKQVVNFAVVSNPLATHRTPIVCAAAVLPTPPNPPLV